MKTLAVVALLLALGACQKQGPLERVGEEIDEAAQDLRNGGETTGNKIDDAIDEVQDAASDIKKDLE
jgi:predicted small lipoprotein YifL